MLGLYTVWCPPSVFMLYVCYLYTLPANVKPVALYKAPLVPPKSLTILAITGVRPLKITLHWASSLTAGLFPADVANAAYYHCAPMLSPQISFLLHVILLFKGTTCHVKAGHFLPIKNNQLFYNVCYVCTFSHQTFNLTALHFACLQHTADVPTLKCKLKRST